ncbi:peptidoglycan-binding protein [Kitasatospora sp. NPDC004240]
MTPTDRPTRLLEFYEVEPDEDCICGGCTARRRARRRSARVRDGGHAAAHSVRRRAAVLMAAVGTALGGSAAGAAGACAAPAPSPGPNPVPTPGPTDEAPAADAPADAGGAAPGSVSPQAAPQLPQAAPVTPVTRAQIIERAQRWVDQRVPYSMSRYWSDGYRQDCSGFVSMAWGLGGSRTTWTLPDVAERITKADLQPGDILLYNDPASPQAGSHVTLFGGWTDATRTRYVAYEQTSPGATRRATPYAYWNHSGAYVPYRFTGLAGGGGDDGTASTAFPGADRFGPGADNADVTRLGRMLVERGGARFYGEGPGPRWGEADRRATQEFQLAQGWRGTEADGLPGKDTWALLVDHRGRDIAPAATTPAPTTPVPTTPGTRTVPAFPGPEAFLPGAVNEHVRQLGERLVARGFGGSYTEGPGPRWTESDRRAVRAFQESLGWRGAEADGYPGPDTWRRLFS